MLPHDAVHDNSMFSIEIMATFKEIKSHLEQSYDKQNVTHMVISLHSYEIHETRQKLISWISYEMTTRVRSSMKVCK